MIFTQPDLSFAKAQLAQMVASLSRKFPRAAETLRDAEDEILAYMAFPNEHWRQVYSTNSLERLNKEIKRRSDVGGIFPNRAAALRLIGAVLLE
ncbi:MAG: transposase [Chloroflexota bacterium]